MELGSSMIGVVINMLPNFLNSTQLYMLILYMYRITHTFT